MPNATNTIGQARSKSLLGIILLALHPLFGITAIIGVLVATMSLNSTSGTPYHSHLKWQITTFWVGFVAYAFAFWYWATSDQTWAIVVAFGFVAYRLSVNISHWTNNLPLNRTI